MSTTTHATATVVPRDPEDLIEFLDTSVRDPLYELAYHDGQREGYVLARSPRVVAASLRRPAAAVTVAYRAYPGGTDEATIPFADLISVHRVELAPDRVEHGDPTDPAEMGRGLPRRVRRDCETVSIPAMLAVLESPPADPLDRQQIVRATKLLAENRPTDCRPAIPLLTDLLRAETVPQPCDALGAVAALADHDPLDVAPVIDRVTPYLTADVPAAAQAATRCVAEVAAADPQSVLDTVPTLADTVATAAPGDRWAAWALSKIARDHPGRVREVLPALRTVVADRDRDPDIVLHAVTALGRVFHETPGEGLPVVDTLAALVEADHHKLRNNAIAALGEVAAIHGDVVADHVEVIAPHVEAADEYGRINATWVLARVAEDRPTAVRPYVPALRRALDDETAAVRTNACLALAAAGDIVARSLIDTLARTDPDPDVRRTAARAAHRLEDA